MGKKKKIEELEGKLWIAEKMVVSMRGIKDYWREEAKKAAALMSEESLVADAFAELCDLFEEAEDDAIRWSKAWKAIAKEYRQHIVELNETLVARESELEDRVKELERLMTEGVGLSPHLGEVEGHVINPLVVFKVHCGEVEVL